MLERGEKIAILIRAGFELDEGRWTMPSAREGFEWRMSEDLDIAVMLDEIGRDVDRHPFPYASWVMPS